jgi:hypothetical protein
LVVHEVLGSLCFGVVWMKEKKFCTELEITRHHFRRNYNSLFSVVCSCWCRYTLLCEFFVILFVGEQF